MKRIHSRQRNFQELDIHIQVIEFFYDLTTLTVLPATLALGSLFVWSLLTILVGAGSEFSLGDWLPTGEGTGLGADGLGDGPQQTLEHALGGVLMAPMKWLNLQDLPFIVWGGIFTLCWWLTSIATYYLVVNPLFAAPISAWWAIPVVGCNAAITAIATKFLTHPMRTWFANTELKAKDLVGEEVTISSYEASTKHGQARYRTGGAPLLLNIRTDGPILPQGTRVWITHYDSRKRVYQVSATTTSSSDSAN